MVESGLSFAKHKFLHKFTRKHICSILDKYPITANIRPRKSFNQFRPKNNAPVKKPYRHPKAKSDRSDIGHICHRVLIEGYVEDENGKILFYLIRNSWGHTWGFHGYALVRPTCLFNFAFPTHIAKDVNDRKRVRK